MTNMTLGQRIAVRRKLIGLSQEVLADKLNVTRQSVSKWESDISIPDIDKLIVLSKLFNVNIGWLLGVESDTAPVHGFSKEQLKTIEELIGRYHPSRRIRRGTYLIAVVLMAVAVLFCIYFCNQIIDLKNKNEDAVNKIHSLSMDNGSLKTQLDQIGQLMSQQINQQQLLTDFFRIQANADENLENISTVFYMRPKIYQENSGAFLSIQNPTTGYYEKIECSWDLANQTYIANFTVPSADGYKFSFLIVNDYGYQEENLLLRDPDIARLGTYCTFHLDPDSLHYQQMKRREPTIVHWEEKLSYSFNLPIYSPHIFSKTAVGYKDIKIKVIINDTVVWEKSYLNAFKEAAGGLFINAANMPVMPNVQVSLPGLNIGDKLQLVLTAETVNGGEKSQIYETLLDYIIINKINCSG